MKPNVKQQKALCLTLLATFCLAAGCKRVTAKEQHMENQAVPNPSMHPVYAGRATLLVPNGVTLKIAKAEVNEVEIHTEQGAEEFEKKWAARVDNIRNNRANSSGFSSVDRVWPSDHTVQFDTTRGTYFTRHWERWGVLGNSIVKGDTVAPLDKAEEARKALADLFAALLPDGKFQPGDFRFNGGMARVPFIGAERITADWQEPVVEPGQSVRAVLNFSLITDAVSKAVTLAELQQEKRQRRAESNLIAHERGLVDKDLRSGPRTVNGLEGEETVSLVTDRQHPEKSTFFAEWLAPGSSNDPYAPSITLTGGVDNIESADVDKAIAQWTAALHSLRFPRQ